MYTRYPSGYFLNYFLPLRLGYNVNNRDTLPGNVNRAGSNNIVIVRGEV